MLKRVYKILAVLLITTLLMTGCWDESSIENRNIVNSVLLDFNENNYWFLVEILNVKGSPNGGEQATPKISKIKAKGENLIQARDDLNRKSDELIYLGATKTVIFTKRAAQKGIEEYLNRLRTETDYRKSLHLVVTSEEPEKLHADILDNSSSLGDALYNTINKQEKMGNAIDFSLGDALENLAVGKIGFLIPEVNMEDNAATLTGYGVFKDTKYIGYISVNQSKGVVYFLGTKPEFLYTINFKDRRFAIKVNLMDKKIKPSFDNNQVKFDIKLKFSSEIQFIDKLFNISDDELIEIEDIIKSKITEDVNLALKTSQKVYQCDYLDFYKYFRAKYQYVFKTQEWCTLYSNAVMNVEVEAPVNGAKNLEINRNNTN